MWRVIAPLRGLAAGWSRPPPGALPRATLSRPSGAGSLQRARRAPRQRPGLSQSLGLRRPATTGTPTTGQPQPVRESDRDDEVVAVDDLLVGDAAQDLGNLIGAQADDPPGVGRGIVGQAAGELGPGGVAQGDDVALAEGADHLHDADGQQAPAAV